MQNKLSILISSKNRSKLFRRALWSLAKWNPSIPWELVIADDSSTEDVYSVVREFSSVIPYKFIVTNFKTFERKTNLKKFAHCPAWTNNVAFKQASLDSNLIALMGNEIIIYEDAINKMLRECEALINEAKNFICFSTTYDCPAFVLDELDQYGSNFNQNFLNVCIQWPLQSNTYHSDVTNYFSITPRTVWELINGYIEEYVQGVAKEDSDFVRRARTIPGGCVTVRSPAITIHQDHQGMNIYHNPSPQVFPMDKWDKGYALTKPLWDNWNGDYHNNQEWPIGEYGVEDILTNIK